MGASLWSIRDSHFNFITITDSSVSNDFFFKLSLHIPHLRFENYKKRKKKGHRAC